MIRKLKLDVLGVIENMSNYSIQGRIEGLDNYDNINININNTKIDTISDTGKFELSLDIFKGIGGESESKRLNVPLLGKLNIDSNLSISGDKGLPYVLNFSDTYNINEFSKIANRISSI